MLQTRSATPLDTTHRRTRQEVDAVVVWSGNDVKMLETGAGLVFAVNAGLGLIEILARMCRAIAQCFIAVDSN